ncbi:hypothetical protein BDY17DRAFT_303590 [Neohortaea acidophila]|uniref:Uncharacterized protein n=1 Tax=Neohortaea acidophila TaxID=245834 RepID=A0A6A6PLD5_9PEZI|nr:uncharacterized protein BDY17DRAFT_303590 [Neohortaea acidophila]KAF2480293.1 hypothetical protein BDY17DRAFT_303590 [Neohortaea acidophila]
MSDDGRLSTSTSSSTTGGPTPNFSRPRQTPRQPPSALKSHSHSATNKPSRERHVHILDAFHEPHRAPAAVFPDEPRFSGESERTDHTSSEHSVGSWDGHGGEVDSARRRRRMDSQRAAAVAVSGRPGLRSGTSVGSNGVVVKRNDSAASSSVEGTQSAPPPPKIVKRVSVDQQSERVAAFEDSESHHTVSESGEEVGAVAVESGGLGRWQSSDADVSSLSEAQIRRLEKKGINPALWVEMQAAKKGKKKWMPHLLGNGFIN